MPITSQTMRRLTRRTPDSDEFSRISVLMKLFLAHAAHRLFQQKTATCFMLNYSVLRA